MSPANTRQSTDHTAKAPENSREWDKVRCVVNGCERPLVWVRGSYNKGSRWQHERGA